MKTLLAVALLALGLLQSGCASIATRSIQQYGRAQKAQAFRVGMSMYNGAPSVEASANIMAVISKLEGDADEPFFNWVTIGGMVLESGVYVWAQDEYRKSNSKGSSEPVTPNVYIYNTTQSGNPVVIITRDGSPVVSTQRDAP